MPDPKAYTAGREFRGAVRGARVALSEAGIDPADDLCAVVASMVLFGFTEAGGLNPEAAARGRSVILAAIGDSQRASA